MPLSSATTGYGVTVGEPSGDLAGHVGGGCTPVHPENEVYKDDGLSGVGASVFGFVESER